MCVLIVHHRLVAGHPIVVGANRDERYDRPSKPPELDPGGRVMAPADLRAGGTWLGLNRDGVFAAITNRSREQADPTRTSRGELCRVALSASSASRAGKLVEDAVRHAPRNPFNLLIVDAAEAWMITGGVETTRRPIESGTHVLSNLHELDAFDLGDLTPPAGVAETLDALATLCHDHRDRDGTSVCKHGSSYGTVSSTLVAVPDDPGAPPRFLYAGGPPCRHPYEDVGSPLMRWTTPEKPVSPPERGPA